MATCNTAQLPTKDATWAWGQSSLRQGLCHPLANAQAAAPCSWLVSPPGNSMYSLRCRQHAARAVAGSGAEGEALAIVLWRGVGLGSPGVFSLDGGRWLAFNRYAPTPNQLAWDTLPCSPEGVPAGNVTQTSQLTT
ncbi:hypothetical protein ABBQ38_014828 [Trebouxia sp. C0009 RCD-2024]